jgi:hypothetical protein
MDFDSMTVPQLKDIARVNNLKKWSKLKKADLIQFLIDNVPGGGRPPSGTPRRRTPSPRRPPSPRPRRRSPSPRPRRRSPSPRPPSRGRSPRPRRRSPSPRPRRRSPSPRPPSRGRSPRRRSPARPPSGPFGVARLKKRQCEKNLRKDVVAAAEDYGIAITKPGGKKKTIKELCAEMDVVQPPMPVATTPPRTRTPSPVRGAVGPPIARMPRPPTPPITDAVPAGMVPKAVYYALTNIEIDDDYIPKAELLKPKVVSKPRLVLYAEELGIRGKSLTKEVLLDRIIAAKIAKDMPVVALIADEIADRVSERVSALGGHPPDQEEVQAVVEQRVSTGEYVSAEAVANEIVAEQQSEDVIASTRRPSSRRSSSSNASSRSSLSSNARSSLSSNARSSLSSNARSSLSSSRSSLSSSRSSLSSSRSSLSSSRSSLSSQASSLMSRSSMSSSARSSVANSVSVASNISKRVAEDIVDEVADRTDRSFVRRAISEVVEEQGVNLDVDPDRLEEVVSDEQAHEAVESVVSQAADDGLISENEEKEILQPLRDEASALPASALPAGVPGPSGLGVASGAQPQPIRRQIRGERDIEKLLREIQKPEESISNMPAIQHRVFRCLGIVN